MSCATCHIIVNPEWFAKTGAPSEDEADMLDSQAETISNEYSVGLQGAAGGPKVGNAGCAPAHLCMVPQ